MSTTLLDEPTGILRAPATLSEGLVTYSARDEFNQATGNATGKVAPVGGTYVALTGSDTTDFTIDATNHRLQRTATTDTGTLVSTTWEGRAIGLDLNLSVTAAKLDIRSLALGGAQTGGLLVRLVDASNFFYAIVRQNQVTIGKVIAGSDGPIASATFSPTATEITLAVTVVGSVWTVYAGPPGSPPSKLASGSDSVLSSTLATGDVYIYDENATAAAGTREYDNFAAWVPDRDAVMFASQSAELRSDGIFREDASGAAYGPVSWVEGDHPRIPNAGLEGRPTEVFVKPSRGDLDQLPDNGIDDISARIYVRPCWLFLGES